ncbi:MAG TPA: glycosyltransferase family 2 protein [Azospirillum sp.]
MPVELAVVIPTLNEVGNIVPLLQRLDRVLAGIAWEAVFVDDDSTDGTTELLRRLAQERANVRCLHRIGRSGLSSACIEGMLSTSAPHIAVMDADLQHDETLLPGMLAMLKGEGLKGEGLDVVVASRFAEGSSLGSFSSARERLSRVGIRLSRLVTGARLTDPLSGFFMLKRDVLEETARTLSGQGFKILLDLFASAPRPLRLGEVPLHFRQRHSGTSKLDTLVMLEFAILLADKLVGRVIPIRFVLFVLVGLFGVAVHLSLLALAYRGIGMGFLGAQFAATAVAMTVNFYLNNQFTYRDRRLKGRRFLWGLASFYVACAIGAVVNLQVAESLFTLGAPWPLAGLLGATVGAVWNFGVSSTFTWAKPRPRPVVRPDADVPRFEPVRPHGTGD